MQRIVGVLLVYAWCDAYRRNAFKTHHGEIFFSMLLALTPESELYLQSYTPLPNSKD